jgi:hypothetical protein
MKSIVKYSILIILILLFCTEVYSQAITWRKSFRTPGNPNYTILNDITQTNDGAYIAVGQSSSLGLPMFAMGISPYGDSLWFYEYPFNAAWRIQKLNDGNFIIMSPYVDLVKINSVGEVIWTKPRPYNLLSSKNIKFINNEFYVCGEKGPNPYQPFLLKLDSLGEVIFFKEYKYSDYGMMLDFVINNDYIFLFGRGHKDSSFVSYQFFIKTDLNGKLIWLKNYESTAFNFSASENSMIKVPIEESFVIGGSGGVNYSSASLLKIDSSANIIWKKNYDSGMVALGRIKNILNDIDDGIISLGYAIGDSSIWTPNTIRLIKFDYNGNEMWRKRYGIEDEALDPRGFRQTIDSGFIIGGMTAGQFPVHILKTDKVGNALPPVSVNNNFQILPTDFKLYQNYPNPFNPSTIIKFELNKAANIEISIYDIKGKLLTTIADYKYKAGVHTVIYEPAGLSSGIYFYNLKSDESIITKKFIYLK